MGLYPLKVKSSYYNVNTMVLASLFILQQQLVNSTSTSTSDVVSVNNYQNITNEFKTRNPTIPVFELVLGTITYLVSTSSFLYLLFLLTVIIVVLFLSIINYFYR